MNEPRFYDTHYIAKRYGVSEQLVRWYCRTYRIARKAGRDYIFFPEDITRLDLMGVGKRNLQKLKERALTNAALGG